MIQLTDIFCVLLRYNGTSNIWLKYAVAFINRDPIKRRALYHCLTNEFKYTFLVTIQIYYINSHDYSSSYFGLTCFWFLGLISPTSFYMYRSQKRKRQSNYQCLYALLWYSRAKVTCKMLAKLIPDWMNINLGNQSLESL